VRAAFIPPFNRAAEPIATLVLRLAGVRPTSGLKPVHGDAHGTTNNYSEEKRRRAQHEAIVCQEIPDPRDH
jgi:hypothetical protein